MSLPVKPIDRLRPGGEAPAQGHVLELRQLLKIFQDAGGNTVRAVDNLDLRCEAGELVSLCGPSGCGKTTALRTIAGLEHPTEGEMFLGGRRINDVPANKRNIGMVFQSYALFPHMSVFDNVAYPLQIRKVAKTAVEKQVHEVLVSVGLEALKHRHPNRMSGGQQQRVALARALVMRPDLLLFDEPLSNLDAKLRMQVRGEIRQLQRSYGITSVYVTHDQAEAMGISDRIAIMKDGVILQIGPPRELYDHPVSQFVADFLGKANFVKGTVRGHEGGKTVMESDIGVLLKVKSGQTKFGPGDSAIAVIRPEAIRLEEPSDRLVGTIAKVEFQGSMIDYSVTVGGQQLQVTELSTSRDSVLAEGTSIGLAIDERSLSILKQ